MRTIYKYEIECNSRKDDYYLINVTMVKGAIPLCVMDQDGTVCIWAEVETTELEFEDVLFACVGTGFGKVPENGKYFGSVMQNIYVWHIYRIEQIWAYGQE